MNCEKLTNAKKKEAKKNCGCFRAGGAYSDIVKWITIDNPTGTLAPNEHQDITFTINVPEGGAGWWAVCGTGHH